ncbi:putative DNA primase large subunit [Ceratocystis fimbriata CBS 114723]|uniref:DNA primase large subunit n=1 Tax=Ceratocystis fimbriata CBS 114723 TaxID=1035309 RepID=A0A2C5WXC5_9PEZI|nr:putative DNA primase large subunit [Ceratocystis fimbriata CBS 114723]
MLRTDHNRIDPKRRNVLDHRKKQFSEAIFKDHTYPYRLNLYAEPPTSDITLEQFEQWAIDRLRVLAELEACLHRNRTPVETATYMKPILDKYLPLDSNTSNSSQLFSQRQKDHYSHFILRLAFCRTDDLRRRFARVETVLFRLRFSSDDSQERAAFVRSLDLEWFSDVSAEEKAEIQTELDATITFRKGGLSVEDETWFKVDWMRVPELVESRKAYLRGGKAYVPGREQTAMICAEFSKHMEQQLELTARAVPRLDEDDRLSPILNHLSKNFMTPDSYMTNSSVPLGAEISAANIDNLSKHFPACMSHLHRTLRRDNHLKHNGRLQYTLFLKGIGLNLEECLMFWRQGFRNITEDKFNKEYRYNVRHAYGDVGGDTNRRGGGYSPMSCQKILTDTAPGPGHAHGCPYRHFSPENLTALLQSMGINDRATIQGVLQDKEQQKFHMGCNRVFEYVHKNELKRAKDESILAPAQLDTIVHPNEYFKRSFILSDLEKSKEMQSVKTESY